MDQKYYLGIDLHRDSFTAYGTDSQGNELLKGKYPNNYESVSTVISSFPHNPSVVVEATRNWMWLAQELQRKTCEVTLAHPLKTKAIASAKIKTDAIDAKTLCHLLRSDMIPKAYIATDEEIENRELSRTRIQFVRDQTKIKNRVLAILAKENIRFTGSDTFGEKGRVWLESQQIFPYHKTIINLNLQRLDAIQKSLKSLETMIKEKGSNSPAVQRLMSIPAIGAITAFTIVAEIGSVKRFSSPDKLTAYLGLVPRLSQSGTHAYYGRITKLGNTYVRWSLVQAAHRLVRKESWAKRFVARIARRGGKKKAIVALARKLAVIIYCVLKEERPYY